MGIKALKRECFKPFFVVPLRSVYEPQRCLSAVAFYF
jgi:hypothetical protein